MSMKDDIYKLYQVMGYLSIDHGYRGLLLQGSARKDEIWLVNTENKVYTIIRITMSSLDSVDFDKERIDNALKAIAMQTGLRDPGFLDIHIGKGEVSDHETYDTLCLDEDYMNGVDAQAAFPGIRRCIRKVSDPNKEIQSIFAEVNRQAIERRKQKKKVTSLLKMGNAVTITFIVLCLLNYLLYFLLSLKYDSAASYVFLGADYKTFTLGLRQFWRLFTVAFSHGSLIHLLANMYSLFYLGSYFERRYGHWQLVLTIFLSTVLGSLASGILTGNSLNVGISGGLYGLMMFYLWDLLSLPSSTVNRQSLYSLIFINLMINFYPNVSWQAHAGGAVAGILLYRFFNGSKQEKYFALGFTIAVIGVLFYKYLSITSINPFYGGTDMQVVKIWRDLGLSDYASKLSTRILEVYTIYY